jgi:starch synthase
MAPSLKILLVGAEAFPYAKVGGLADVLGALPKALAAEGADVTLVLPRYRSVDIAGFERVAVPDDWSVPVGGASHGFGLMRGRLPGSEAAVVLLENDHFFHRWSVYNAEGGLPFQDDAERWIFFQRGALEACRVMGLHPDVIHAHESQAGLLPTYVRTLYGQDAAFQRTATVFTIHNLAYQGMYGPEAVVAAGFGREWLRPGSPIEMHGGLNFMKAGILSADIVTTVSPTYAREIQSVEEGCGLDQLLRARGSDVVGVLNGIDRDVWSPQKDARIPRNYEIGDWEGKRACKKALLERLGLPASDLEAPLLAFVGRLVPQKGCDLFAEVLADLLTQPIQFVALGSGATEYEDLLRGLAVRHPEKARAILGFDEEMAHWIQAGADILLMPSRYEPCGLNQMYAMAYGTVPVARATGGLKDTVEEAPPGAPNGTGFRFEAYTAFAFKEAVYRALAAWGDRPRWERLMRNGMARNLTWSRSAREYVGLYERAVRKVRGA